MKSKALEELLELLPASKLYVASEVQMHLLDVRFQAQAGHCCRALNFPIPTVSTINMTDSKIVHTDCEQCSLNSNLPDCQPD